MYAWNIPCMQALHFPNFPAVVYMNYYAYFLSKENPGQFWWDFILNNHCFKKIVPLSLKRNSVCALMSRDNAEHENNEFALYYHLPTLSLKSAVFPLFRKVIEGNIGSIYVAMLVTLV